MPYTKVLLHIIWSTKNRIKSIKKDIKPKLLNHILKNAKEKEIFIESINSVEDHIHILISLGREQTISKVVQLIKGESSNWVNKSFQLRDKFEWQDEYFAVSVSESAVDKVKEYIKNQEEHHRVKSFDEEYELFLEKYGFKK